MVTANISRTVRKTPRIKTVQDLNKLMARARAFCPGYDVHAAELRRQYQGHNMESVAAAMLARFPRTAWRMPNAPYNLAALIAEEGATVYDYGVLRKFKDSTPDLQAGLADLIRSSDLETKLPELDRRLEIVRTMFVSIRSDSIEQAATGRSKPKTTVDLLWPNDVYIVPHPLAPTVEAAALSILVRIAGEPAGNQFIHWYRDTVVGVGFEEAVGPWKADLVRHTAEHGKTITGAPRLTESLEVRPLWDPYPLPTIPLLAVHRGIPEGAPVVDVDRNLPSVLNNANASLMGQTHTVDMNTAPVWVHKTNRQQPAEVVLAPGVKVNIPIGEEMTSESQQADLQNIRLTTEQSLDILMTTRRLRAGVFVKGSEPDASSGVALRIKNIPAEKKRREAVAQMVPWEEERLLPLLVEVNDHFAGTQLAAGGAFSVTVGEQPDYESPQERQTRLADAVDRRWITEAQAAVQAGFYRTVEEAASAIIAIKEADITKMVAGQTMLSGEEDDDEDEDAQQPRQSGETEDDGPDDQ